MSEHVEPNGSSALQPPAIDMAVLTELHIHDDERDSEPESGVSAAPGDSKKKKKKKPKKRATAIPTYVSKSAAEIEENGGGVPAPRVPQISTDQDIIRTQLRPGAKTYRLPYAGLPDIPKDEFAIFMTPSCSSLILRTERLVLRPVQISDLLNIRRIKTEPIVQRTQLYGQPGLLDIKPAFLTTYLASSIPRLTADTHHPQYTFAITAKEPSIVDLKSPDQIKLTNRIKNAEGYLGNIALQIEVSDVSKAGGLAPVKDEAWVFPTHAQWQAAGTTAKMFFEIHPQLWGNGIVSEAFAEVLRFAFEELGVQAVAADPCEGNEASIKICTKSHLTFSHRSTEASKPQMFYNITRTEWLRRNRAGAGDIDHWGGKRCCRWCMNPRVGEAKEKCEHCEWACYCSLECRRADWLRQGGHQDECSQT